ncbi:MAG: LamG domain-containing protein, partial [Chitinophagaceae bacterium]
MKKNQLTRKQFQWYIDFFEMVKGRLALIAIPLFLFSSLSFSQSGSTLHLDGVNDYIDFPVSLTNDDESQTLEFWFKYSSLPNFNKPIVIRGDDAFGGWNIQLQLRTDGKLQSYKCCMTTIYHPVGTTTLSANTWYHIAMVHDASNGNTNIYLNGNLEMTGFYSTNLDLRSSTVGYRFGRDNMAWTYGGASTGYINQFIDEIQIWNTLRTQSQIQSDAAGQSSPYSSNLKLYAKLDEGTVNGDNTGLSNTIINETGNGNGTINNLAKNGNTSNWVSISQCPSINAAMYGTTSLCSGYTTILNT